MPEFDECPHCGERFKRGRLACPECGSDARTGWASSEEIDYRSVEIPDTWDEAAHGTRRRSRLWIAIAVVALAAFVIAFVLAR